MCILPQRTQMYGFGDTNIKRRGIDGVHSISVVFHTLVLLQRGYTYSDKSFAVFAAQELELSRGFVIKLHRGANTPVFEAAKTFSDFRFTINLLFLRQAQKMIVSYTIINHETIWGRGLGVGWYELHFLVSTSCLGWPFQVESRSLLLA